MSAGAPTLAMLIAHANARAAAGDRGGAIAAYREAVRVAPGRVKDTPVPATSGCAVPHAKADGLQESRRRDPCVTESLLVDVIPEA